MIVEQPKVPSHWVCHDDRCEPRLDSRSDSRDSRPKTLGCPQRDDAASRTLDGVCPKKPKNAAGARRQTPSPCHVRLTVRPQGLRSMQPVTLGFAFDSSIGSGKLTSGPYTPPPRPVY